MSIPLGDGTGSNYLVSHNSFVQLEAESTLPTASANPSVLFFHQRTSTKGMVG